MFLGDRHLATAGEDRTVRVWPLAPLEEGGGAGDLQAGRHPITCLAAGEGGLLAAGDCGGGLHLWQVGAGDGGGEGRHQVGPGAGGRLVCKVSVARHFAPGEEGEGAGCEVLALHLRGPVTQEEEEGEGPPSLVATGSAVGEVLAGRQEVLVATNLGLLLLELRSRAALQVIPFTEVAGGASQFQSMASSLALATLASRVACLLQASEGGKVRLVTAAMAGAPREEAGEAGEADCLVINLEDENANTEEAAIVSVIPREQILVRQTPTTPARNAIIVSHSYLTTMTTTMTTTTTTTTTTTRGGQ